MRLDEKESVYKKKVNSLNKLRSEYKHLILSEGTDTFRSKELLKQVYSLNKELKEIDESIGRVYRNGAYKGQLVGDYKSILTISSLLKVVFYVALTALVINLVQPYLPDFETIISDRFTFNE